MLAFIKEDATVLLETMSSPGSIRSEDQSEPPAPVQAASSGQARVSLGLRAVWFSIAFFSCAELGRFLSVQDFSYVSFWLPAGLYVAVLLRAETHEWPWFILAAFPANLAFDLLHGTPFSTLSALYCANTAEAVTGAWLVRRFVAAKPSLVTLKEFLGLIGFAGLLSPIVGATIGASALFVGGLSQSLVESWKLWWASEAMAILLVAPFVLVWFSKLSPVHPRFDRPGKLLEAGILAVGVVVSTYYILVEDQGIGAPYNFRLMVFALWAGLRFGTRGATASSLLLAFAAAFFTTHFQKGLTASQIASGEYVLTLQTFLAMSSLVALIPALVLGERDLRVLELKESEERFRNLTAAAFEGVVITEKGRILDINDQGLKMIGYSRIEMIGREAVEFVTPETRSNIVESIRGGGEGAYEHRLLRKDGTVFEAEAQAKVIRVGNREMRMTAIRDITERKRVEEALRFSEERFRSAMQHSPIGMAIVAPDGRWLEINPALCAIVGYTAEELLATDFQSITHPADIEKGLECARRMLKREIEQYQMEKRYLHKDGHVVWIQLNFSLVWSADGKPRHFVGQIQDITGRRQTEQSLRENQAKMVMAMDMARLAQWEHDLVDNRITFDEAFYKLLRTTAAREGGMSMSVQDYAGKFIPASDSESVAEAIGRAMAATAPALTRQLEHRFIRADGSLGVMMVRFETVKDAAGRIVKAYGVSQDITDQKLAEEQRRKLEEQLRQAQKMEALGTLAGGTAHEFNNMLSIIIAYAELGKMDLEEGHPVRLQLDEILKASMRARDIVRQILTFSRRREQSRELIPIQPVVLEAVKLLRTTLPPVVEIETDFGSDAGAILGNTTQIHQVITNVCTNAWHAMHGAGGLIKITHQTITLNQNASATHPALREGSYELLTIADNGKGMDAATLARVFEPFFTTKAPGEGSGLGLAVVHGVMEAHDGAVVAQSEPGQGAMFHLYFPTQSTIPVQQEILQKPSIPSGRGQCILVVDDEVSLVRALTKFLERLGYQTFGAHSAEEALTIFHAQSGRFDLVITDLTMPGMTGMDLAHALCEIRPGLPIVLATGFGAAETPDHPEGSYVTRFLQKPFTPDIVAQVVNEILSRRPVEGGPTHASR